MRATLSALLVLLLAGCAAPAAPSACASKPEPPLRMEFDVEDACAFYGEGSRATLRLTGNVSALRAGVVLPAGVHLVSGNLAWEGDLAGAATREATLRADPGRHALHAWTDAPTLRSYGGAMAPSLRLVVEGDATDARVRAEPQPAPPVTLRIDAEEGNASRLVFTVKSAVAMEAEIHVWLSWPALRDQPNGTMMTGHPEWEGERDYPDGFSNLLVWKGRLTADETRTLRYHAPPPEWEGEWTVGMALLPDARVTTHVHRTEVGWLYEEGRGELLRNRPGHEA